MKSTGFTAFNRRRKLHFLILLTALIGIGLLLFLSFTRGAELLQRRSQKLTGSVSIAELWEEGRYPEIITIAEKRLAKDPMDQGALLYAGYSRYYLAISHLSAAERNLDLDRSIRYLRLLLSGNDLAHPERVHYVLGKAYLSKGYYWSDLALRYIRAAYDSGYEPADIHEYLGRAYSRIGDHETALEWYEKASEDYPTDKLYLSLGEQSFQLGQYDEAAMYYQRSIDVSRDDSLKKRGLSQLGKLYYDVGNYGMARKVLEDYVNMESGNEDNVFLLAETYYALGLENEARQYWFAVIRINKGHVGALKRLYN